MPESEPTNHAVDGIRAALLSALNDSHDGIDAVTRSGRMAVELLPVDGTSISLMTHADRRETLYVSGESVERIEALQFSLGEGSCFEPFETRRPVLVADLDVVTTTAWPIFAGERRDEPVSAVFAFP